VKSDGAKVEFRNPKELFDSGYLNLGGHAGGTYHTYAVFPDGQQFVIPRPPAGSDTPSSEMTVVVNWPLLLKN
jgi:hypothetical protein